MSSGYPVGSRNPEGLRRVLLSEGRVLLATLIGVLSLLTLEIRYIPVLRLLDGRRHIAKMSDDSPPEGM